VYARTATPYADEVYTEGLLLEVRRGGRDKYEKIVTTKSERKVNMEDEVEGQGTVFGSSSSHVGVLATSRSSTVFVCQWL